jgi:hypothetical protein
MPEIPPREIVREHEFEEQLRALIPDLEAADDFTAAAEFILAHHPDGGTPAVADQSVWYLPMMPVRGRRVSLFYTFDARAVHFLALLAYDD